MATAALPEIRCTARGGVGEDLADIARDHVARALAHVDEPVLSAEVRLAHEPDPTRERPFVAEATVVLAGATIRAHVAASTMAKALDLLDQRLRRRLERYLDVRRAKTRSAGTPPRRDGLDEHRPERVARQVGERELVRHKTFAVGEMTPDEAIDLLELLGHDFVLFRDLPTGADAVVWHGPEGYVLADAGDAEAAAAAAAEAVTPLAVAPGSVRRGTVEEALEELDLDLEPFVFFVDEDGRGQVAYRRYDGHYGLIAPG